MIDFLEYVVAELRSGRLSKEDASALVRQFSRRVPAPTTTTLLHPLLHRNASDLNERRYESTFSGEEFFLADHRVSAKGGTAHRVLPGVAYLEMVRAAIEQTWPVRPDSAVLELHNTVWAQPVVVDATKEVGIALSTDDGEEIEFEIYSHEGEREIVHCQGRAIFGQEPPPSPLDLERIGTAMEEGGLDPDRLYALCDRMGVLYGASFRAVAGVRRGAAEVLAHLRLPAGSTSDYVLHPSLMDGALQAAVGLTGDGPESGQPRLPFALETLRIFSPCTTEMRAWLRYSAGSRAGDKVVKLDVDLCDERGNVCVQMRGFSWRVLSEEAGASATVSRPAEWPEMPVEQRFVEAGAGEQSGEIVDLAERTQDYLRRQFSGSLRLQPDQIDPRAPLENYGIDSILAMKLTNQLETVFGSLPKTLFFEFQTLRELAGYLVSHHGRRLEDLLAPRRRSESPSTEAAAAQQPASAPLVPSRRARRRRSAASPQSRESEPVAIIGLSGRYPEAIDLQAYWENLRQGKDCITEVPKERWDWREYYSEDRHESGRHYSKWGGFIAGVDEFDPLFFNISPADAELIDPQERLFLQHAWMAIEDAGYTRAALQIPHDHGLPGQVGVYAGVMYSEYQLFGAEASARGRRLGVPGSAASIANRVSYLLNLHGPSMTLDTMCSSSLTAIHLACQDLKQGRISLAIAGGVNVSIHPNKYLVLSQGQFISSDGHCQSFGEGGDGYIPGEGVGVVVLKRLSDAERDGDHIYGIIRGSALNHGGKTNGYSVPSPQAQTDAIALALAEARVDARHVSYLEAHGTGTKLGDPIEIAALGKAFEQYTADTQFCLVGSVKSNIGHCESAAGIAGLTKILLQMQHQQIVPSLHSEQLNPHIDFDRSPFIVNQALRAWERPAVDGRVLPRIAGISSFGAGGSNAHMIVEEYEAPVAQAIALPEVAVLLSARTPAQLQQKARDLLEYLRPRRETVDLVSLAHTLQSGRESMEHRLGFIVASVEDLLDKLEAWLAGEPAITGVHYGQPKRNQKILSLFDSDAGLQQAIDRWISLNALPRLLDLWIEGVEPDWSRLYGAATPRRMSLPAYPFARERYWVDAAAGGAVAGAVTTALHPLLHSNVSDLNGQRYRSIFTGDEFFFADHRVESEERATKVLPAAAYLEMVRAAIGQALPQLAAGTAVELQDVVWAQPIAADGVKAVDVALLPAGEEEIEFEVSTREAEEEVIHCRGRAVFVDTRSERLELEQLQPRMIVGRVAVDDFYAACARMGLRYGPSFRAITAIDRGSGEVLAQLRLTDNAAAKNGAYELHPAIVDGALQAAIALADPDAEPRPRLPFALDSLRVLGPSSAEMVAWVRYSAESQSPDDVVRLDIDLCDAGGNVCAQMRGLSARPLRQGLQGRMGTVLAVPVWEATELDLASPRREFAEEHVLAIPADPRIAVAERYSDGAIACLEQVQRILRGRPQGKVLLQLVVTDPLLTGVSALLETAAQEHPQFTGQVLLVPDDMPHEELERRIVQERYYGRESLVRHDRGAREILRWQEIESQPEEAPGAYRENGVYLITGGTGGLGMLFAREIVERADGARVILTGRSVWSEEKQALIDGLAGRATYRQVDLGKPEEVAELIASIRNEHGRLDGILHCAGMIADGFLLKKNEAQFREVLAPKVAGTWNLDQATRDVELDFFVLFSSIAGAMGNVGQSDYAAANAFMDRFATYRNGLVAAGQRHGRTRSINWPLWQAGGMTIDPAAREMLRESTGLEPMQTETGMRAFRRSLALPSDQLLVMEGDAARIRRTFLSRTPSTVEVPLPAATEVAPASAPNANLAERTEEYLRKQLAGVLKMPSHRIDGQAALEQYGIDSILAMKLTGQLEKTFGPLPKTLFFEYRTIHALTEFFITQFAAQLNRLLSPEADRPAAAITVRKQTPGGMVSRRRFAAPRVTRENREREPVAIIGLSGRYPEAPDLEAYWKNLRDGKDCITEVPRDRWDWRDFFSEDRSRSGRHYSKWGGFISGVDEFDPLFFNISPLDAEVTDPQERLFLQHAWMAIEDAGYTRASLQVPQEGDLPGQVGVYAGVMYSEYQLLGTDAAANGKRIGIPGSTASIANRVSHILDLHGPSMTLDTMCSSSLTAIHLACEDLRHGRTSLAIAGGVNVSIHPNKYLVLSQGQFISSEGHCQSFGRGGDGYIPGEGVGVVVLKRLSDAKRDGDHIYGVIRGSALNHGGRTNGYTVPNPQAQASVIARALSESRMDARHVSYLEAHGTGTTLGDPIEIAALNKAFGQTTQEKTFCRIGSVKSNIGHCESAAGIAGLTKILLQMQHRQIVPSLHSSELNPHIDFENSPFVVNQTLREWEQPVIDGRRVPRIAGLSSFGAGGSNAHIVIEEHEAAPAQAVVMAPVIIVLSARTLEQLRQKASDLLDFVESRRGDVDLAEVAYTLQVGREAMEWRLGLVVSSLDELADKLRAYAAGEPNIEDLYRGVVSGGNESLSLFSGDADLQQTVDRWIASRKLSRLLELWVRGLSLDWNRLYGEIRPRRISLPVYPFAKERYWIDSAAPAGGRKEGLVAVLHPLLHSNVSRLNEQRYRTTFTGEESFVADHRVTGRNVVPGVVCLEMARAAIENALPEWSGSAIELRNVVWTQPIVVEQPQEIFIALTPLSGDRVEITISSHNDEIIHCQGTAAVARDGAGASLDLAQIEAEMDREPWEPAILYSAFEGMGLGYGPAFRALTALHRGSGQLLARLRLPESLATAAGDYVLHPSLLDSAMQAAAGLVDNVADLSGEARLPFALESLRIVAPCSAEMAAWVRYAPGSAASDRVVKVDIDLCDERGAVCVRMRGLSSRVVPRQQGELGQDEPIIASTQLEPIPAAAGAVQSIEERMQEWLRAEFSSLMKLPTHRIDPQAALEKYGIDSILAMKLTSQLEKTFGSLSKTLFFEYQTIAALAGYFVRTYPDVVRTLLASGEPGLVPAALRVEAARPRSMVRRKRDRFAARTGEAGDIAIVGLAGRYPQAANLREFWRNLQNGRDSITEIPSERWDHSLYFDPDPAKAGRSYSKWGGFLSDVDKFDPLFFNISPKEASLLDPQERLFLETAWETIEDAGYSKESISGRRVGVFVGVMWGQYELFGADVMAGGGSAFPGSSYSSIANRVSYFFDLHGPSMAVDTMCSSSLTAIHLACKELWSGDIEAAIAGGVNLSIHPYKYLSLSQGKFVASDGRCRSFGAGGDGYVPGEGVGAVLLKPLAHALDDGDQIHAVIRASALNHGGKTNGYTVPNPVAQGDLILEALRKANVDPRTLSYVETHGTGTSLGDPIEITGLMRAFESFTQDKQFCAIGSVKSNIGHLESAAGIAALTKALLQLRHAQLVPSLHAEPRNPHIDFENSPFYVQTRLTEWMRDDAHPRRLAVSSFGAGGSNAHLILEEFVAPPAESGAESGPELFVLSAKDPEALRRYAGRITEFLDETSDVSLASLAYTLQIGRTAMGVRLAILASSVDELRERIAQWTAMPSAEIEGVHYANVRAERSGAERLIDGPEGETFVAAVLATGNLEKIARLWVAGADVDWSKLVRHGNPAKISLPTYPFARERCWIDQKPAVVQDRKRVPRIVQTEPVEEKRRLAYVPQWAAKPLASRDTTETAGPMLIVDGSDDLWTAMSERSQKAVLVKPGRAFAEIAPGVYTVEPEKEEDFQALVQELKAKALLPTMIVHRGAAATLGDDQQVTRQLREGLYALFHLCRALMRAKTATPLRIVSVSSGDPLGAAAGGFLRTLTVEEPGYLTKSVDIRNAAVAQEAEWILTELAEEEWSAREIRYDDEGRRVRLLAPDPGPEKKPSALPLRRNGVYLLTGGLGGLGLVFAEYLAKNYGARLVLTGRSAPNASQEESLKRLEGHGAEVLVLQADAARAEEMERVVREAKARFSEIHGVIHAAGVHRDAFLLRKSREEIDAVLASKIYGTIHLDAATREEPLDFFVLFSSIAGVIGNLGQSDYAFASRFLDAFAEHREVLRAAQQRSGRTLSIDWPLWEEGGMTIPPDHLALLEKETGLSPLPTVEGIRHWEDSLRSEAIQSVTLYGVPSKIARFLGREQARPAHERRDVKEALDSAALYAKTERYLKERIGEEIKLDADRIDADEPLASFGIDSVAINRINAEMERDLGALPKTLLYEHETIRELASYLVREAGGALSAKFASGGETVGEPAAASLPVDEDSDLVAAAEVVVADAESDDLEAIAIIGMHGSYPQSETLDRYWENLKAGRDLIGLVPSNRWDWEGTYDPRPEAAAEGKIYCKWGAFLDHHDRFDPQFFKISTAEAKWMDPQERLFLESVWAAVEDAGYTRESLKKRYPKGKSADVGVFVGVTTNTYQLWAPEERMRGNYVAPSAMPWSIANRVSYFFNFNGPSLPVDTACSSSLVAIHLACESLRRGECRVAVAGGVNLYLHPAKYESLCQRRMLSVGGKTCSYGAGDDGFVPGEGVGSVVLKPLSRAVADGDLIYGVIRGSAYDHSGRSNGYTAPNPISQRNLISQTLEKAGIPAETIGYVEGHGTGTQLGDSIEIVALSQAFRKQTEKTQFCPIGSVKANIGHSESAAGVASLAKVLLQMRHGQLAPSIHSEEPNPNIELEQSPFYLQHGLTEWPAGPESPRRALINSFGAGGVNACMIVEEYPRVRAVAERRESGPQVFVLSARNEERLQDYVEEAVAYLRGNPGVDLAGFCQAFQFGREAMEERLAIVATSVDELTERLEEWSRRGAAAGVLRGTVEMRRGARRVSTPTLTAWASMKPEELASKWIAGEEVDWESAGERKAPHRAGLPTYPFARDRYWVSDAGMPERPVPAGSPLHPLIAANSSTLQEISFSSALSESAFYAVDHKVHDESILPGAAFLEMACIAGNLAGERSVRRIADVVWMQPLSFRYGAQTLRTVLRKKDDGVQYEISSIGDDDEPIVYAEGRLVFDDAPAEGAESDDRVPLDELLASCQKVDDGAACYGRFDDYGLHYGPSFQTIQELYVDGTAALSKLTLADHLKRDFADFILHPSIVDGALQTIAGAVRSIAPSTPFLPFALDEIEILRPVTQNCYAYAERAEMRSAGSAGVMKFNIRLVNEHGEVLVRFRNLYVRPFGRPEESREARTA